MSKVIGIDTKSTGMHWCSSFGIGLDTDPGDRYGWIECKEKNEDERRSRITLYAASFFHKVHVETWKSPDPVQIFCEEPLALQNGKTTRLLGLAAGAIWAACGLSANNFIWHWVDQSTWKKNVLGRGIRPRDFEFEKKANAEKEWIRSVVVELPGFKADWSDAIKANDFDGHPDLYDAWALKTYGVRVLASL